MPGPILRVRQGQTVHFTMTSVYAGPPERAWLVRLHLVGPAWDQITGEVEVIAVLRSDEMQIILR